MNRIIIKGNLTKDPVKRTTNTEEPTTVASFDVAVSRPGKDKGADFFHCAAFGKKADFVLENFSKGKPILIEGVMQNNSYRNKNDEMVYSYNLIARSIEFAGEIHKTSGTQTTDANLDDSVQDSTEADDETFDFLKNVMPY